MKNYRSIIWVNSLCLLVMISIIACAYSLNLPIGGLFNPPASPEYPTAGVLTHTFELLCCIPPVVCAFTFGLLNKIKPHNQNNSFIFYSALLMLGFLINEIYRVHIIFAYFGIPKLLTIFVYAIIAFSYGKAFWKRIKSTPYILLLASLILLIIAVTIDSLHIQNISNFAEGIPKLFSGLNAALYFWLVCYKEIINSFSKNT